MLSADDQDAAADGCRSWATGCSWGGGRLTPPAGDTGRGPWAGGYMPSRPNAAADRADVRAEEGSEPTCMTSDGGYARSNTADAVADMDEAGRNGRGCLGIARVPWLLLRLWVPGAAADRSVTIEKDEPGRDGTNNPLADADDGVSESTAPVVAPSRGGTGGDTAGGATVTAGGTAAAAAGCGLGRDSGAVDLKATEVDAGAMGFMPPNTEVVPAA